MTCQTCNGTMILPNPNGIGVVACTDCKDGKIKRSNMKETTKPEASLFDARVALIVALIAFATCFFVVGEASAQTVYPAITKEAGQYNNGNIEFQTDGLTRFRTSNVDTVAQKKDTILVDVLCTLIGDTHVARESIVISEPWHEQKQFGFVPYVTTKRQERTLEWQTWMTAQSSFLKNNYGLSDGVASWETGWRVTETRWLDITDGCFHITKIENE